MKEKLKAMYQSGAIDMNSLLKAVERGWVTMEDVIEIVGEDNSLAIIKFLRAVTPSSLRVLIWS